jgi:hypothetical protein
VPILVDPTPSHEHFWKLELSSVMDCLHHYSKKVRLNRFCIFYVHGEENLAWVFDKK